MLDKLTASRLRKTIDELLPTGHPTIARISQCYNIPVRTLQRRLHNEGISHRELLDDIRQEKAQQLLDTTALPIAEIAKHLGFSDASNFSRSFQRWIGVSPSQYHQRK